MTSISIKVMNHKEMIMSSKDFVDALARGSNLDAEDAFKSAVGQKVQDTLENKRKELAKGFVNKHIPEPEDDKTV